MSEIIYCANGCTRAYEGERIPVTTDPPSQLCRRCEDNLRTWLNEIPERWTQLPRFLIQGPAEKDPDAKMPRRTEAPAPMRLGVVDLLDDRLGRKWNGLIPSEDRRGPLGVLHPPAQEIRQARNLAPLEGKPTVTGECKILQRHFLWLVEQEWVGELHEQVKRLHTTISREVGIHPPRAVGKCAVDLPDETVCGGPLLPSRNNGGVHCPRCGTLWDPEKLRLLGMALQQESA